MKKDNKNTEIIEQENIQPQSTSEIGKHFEKEFQQLQSERQNR